MALPDVHQMAGNFNKQVQAYEQARPGYPPALLKDVCDKLHLKAGMKVLDLAAGPGKLTRVLADFKFDMTAVEPAAGMRAGFNAVLPHIPVLEGTSTKIPIPDAALDAVFIGQAFHWFATKESLLEIRRVLKKGGALVLIWNTEDGGSEGVKHLVPLYTKYEFGVPQYRHGTWRNVFNDHADSLPFTPLQELHMNNPVPVTRDLIWARILSISYISAMSAEQQAVVKKEILDYIEKAVPEFIANKAADASVIYPYRTDAFWTIAK